MKILSQFQRWFTSRHSPNKMLITKAFLVDLDLLKHCARIIRGDEPGRGPRSGGTFPQWGRADLEGRTLMWSGPFSFELDIQYGLLVEALPGVYVPNPRSPFGHPTSGPDPLLTFVIGESATWAILWPRSKDMSKGNCG